MWQDSSSGVQMHMDPRTLATEELVGPGPGRGKTGMEGWGEGTPACMRVSLSPAHAHQRSRVPEQVLSSTGGISQALSLASPHYTWFPLSRVLMRTELAALHELKSMSSLLKSHKSLTSYS